MDLTSYRRIAEEAARLAGEALLAGGAEFEGVAKEEGRDIKLHADKAAEKRILAHLNAHSDFPVLSEEAGWVEQHEQAGGGLFWVVDPLDGSANYNRNIPLCCVSIALVDGSEPLLGVCYDFNHGRLISGVKGVGATLNGEPVSVSKITEKTSAILMTGLPVWRDYSREAMAGFAAEFAHWKKVRMIGSAGLSTALVGIGSADRYQEDNIMFWDVAAGAAITCAAGGRAHISEGPLDAPKVVMIDNGCLPL